jgi:mono/diheme cytochrome c family protein
MKALRIGLLLAGIFILLLIAGGTYVKLALPNTGPSPDLKVVLTPKRIANGRYLANHVTVCMDCHSKRDWSLFAGPITGTDLGAGGEVFNRDMGFPGVFYASNITPAAIGNWTDGDLFRAVTTGVSKDGRALFPLMASHRFGKMDREDIYDIIAYLRTLKPVRNNIPHSEPDFPVNFLINTMPKKADFSKKPNLADTIKYGAYLINAAGCVECHSAVDKGSVIAGTEFGGGMEFKQPSGILRSPNITFDIETGIGTWSKAQFVRRFKSYTAPDYKPAKVGKGQMNTPMPWTMFGGMKETDLEALYVYLRQLRPIQNNVPRLTQAD